MDRLDKRRVQILAEGVKGRANAALPQRLRPPKPNLPFPYGAPSTPQSVDPLPTRCRVGADFETDWARHPVARMARIGIVEALMRPAVALLARPERLGMDRLDALAEDEAVIFVANHHSHVDTPLLLTSLPGYYRSTTVVAAAADYFFGNRVSGATAALALNAFPMERSRTTRTSANKAAELIEDGWSLLIFPEGGRSKDGWGQPFRAGASYLAQRCDVPVVPIFISGTDRILRKGKALPSPAQATVLFGDPLRSEPDESSRAFVARIESAVEALADESSTDWWQARQRAHAGQSPALTGPEASSWRRQWARGEAQRFGRRRTERWPYVR